MPLTFITNFLLHNTLFSKKTFYYIIIADILILFTGTMYFNLLIWLYNSYLTKNYL